MAAVGTTAKIVLGFVTLLIGVVLLGQVSSNNTAVLSVKYVNNESLDISSARTAGGNLTNATNLAIANRPTSWKSEDCPITNFVLRNKTGATQTLGTDYLFTASTGYVNVQNRSFGYGIGTETTNTTYIDYRYCGDDYINSTFGRTSVQLIPGFFALALMIVSVGLFYSVAKDYDLIS